MQSRSVLNYTGHVKFKILRGNTVIQEMPLRNTGTPFLFELLCFALCGKLEKYNTPQYIDLQRNDESSMIERYDSILTSRIPITNKLVRNYLVEDTQETFPIAAVFTAFIPASSLVNASSEDTVFIDRFSLHSMYQGDLGELAYILLEEPLELDTDLTKQFNYAVEWAMLFSNTGD